METGFKLFKEIIKNIDLEKNHLVLTRNYNEINKKKYVFMKFCRGRDPEGKISLKILL